MAVEERRFAAAMRQMVLRGLIKIKEDKWALTEEAMKLLKKHKGDVEEVLKEK